MKLYSPFVICTLIVATGFLNIACSKLSAPSNKPGQTIENLKPKPVPESHRSYFYCSHKVGAVVKPGESIRYIYKTADFSLDFTLSLEAGGFVYDGTSTNLSHSTLTTADSCKHCWGKDNCFVAEKNKDGSWTIKSLPFNKSGQAIENLKPKPVK